MNKDRISADQSAKPSGIKYISLWENSGYGIAAKRYIQGLATRGIPLTWSPMVTGSGWGLGYQPFLGETVGDSELDQFCNIQIPYDTVIIHTVPEYYPHWCEREKGKIMIGYTVWETDRIPDHWKNLLNRVDRLLVPCQWNQQVFRDCGVAVPIDVVPHIMSNSTLDDGVCRNQPSSGNYVFYTINTWTARKALWNTIDCYLNTFSADDPVVLLVKTSKRDMTRQFLGKFVHSTRGLVNKMQRLYRHPAKIKLLVNELADDGIVELHRQGDCYISLTHAEGWGLGAFDAASYGNPVIMTAYGGQLDYLTDKAYLVDYATVPVRDALGKKSYSENQNWAAPNVNHASSFMRYVFDNQAEARRRGDQLRDHIRSNFNESLIIKSLCASISASEVSA